MTDEKNLGFITINGKTFVIDKSIIFSNENMSLVEAAIKQDCVSEIRDKDDKIIWRRGEPIDY